MTDLSWHQLDIFGGETVAHARRGDPGTSHEAARSVKPEVMRALHRAQLILLSVEPDTHNGLWLKYLTHMDDMGWPTVSLSGFRTRVSELHAAAYVRDTGRRAILPTGRRATVWEITTTGRDALAAEQARRSS